MPMAKSCVKHEDRAGFLSQEISFAYISYQPRSGAVWAEREPNNQSPARDRGTKTG